MRRIYGMVGVIAAAFGATIAIACAWDPGVPIWSLEKSVYDPNGNSAFLSPANDSRVNMMLLLGDRRSDGLALSPAGKSAGLVLFSWDDFKQRITPTVYGDGGDGPGRCQTNANGAEAFARAVAAADAVPAVEKAALIAARRTLTECGAAAGPPSPPITASMSAMDQAFATYIDGTRAFYRGDFPAAQAAFDAVRRARDPWLRETGAYMVARTALNGAQATIFDAYGYILPVEKRDQTAVAAADAAFEAYLRAYPRGLYVRSATGLLRRVYWLAGDDAKLSAAYQRIIDTAPTRSTTRADLDLAQEIDVKLFTAADPDADTTRQPTALNGSLLLAVDDLMRMRSADDPACCTPIAIEEIEAQRARFGADVALFDYVRAAHSFFVRHDPAAVLRLIPDASHQRRFGTLEFSRQMLRGLALGAAKDGNARQFWIDLLPGATGPYQSEAVQLALATHDERHGKPERVFAAGSSVTNPIIRELLLTYKAGPALLRAQAQDASAPRHERDVALYLLLSKGLQRGFYADFLRDIRLVPAGAPNAAGFYLNDGTADAQGSDAAVPIGVFTRPATLGEFGCPALSDTVRALAADPHANTPRLCLAEFLRTNAFDHFAYDTPLPGNGLAGTTPAFPGTPYARQSTYQAVIADRGASAEERAFALHRAIRCYAPSGSNDCGGKDVDLAQRRAWFRELKARYPSSRWARASTLYW